MTTRRVPAPGIDAHLSRRALLAGAIGAGAAAAWPRGPVLAAGGGASPAGARAGAGEVMRGSLALPEFDARTQLLHWLKLVTDLSGAVTHAYTAGTVYGFRPQADDVTLAEFARPLYGYRAVLARQVVGEERGGWRLRQRAWSHYVDAASGEPIVEFDNPYTGRRVKCPPLSFPATELVYTPDGLLREQPPFPAETSEDRPPFRLRYAPSGDRVAVRREVYSRFRPPGIDWYKLEADVTVHDVSRADLLDERLTRLPNAFLHNLVAEWQTWMEMHGTPGHILFSGLGRTHVTLDDVPGALREAFERRFPGTLEDSLRWRANRTN